MRYRIRHQTTYRYDADVALSYHLAHLTPRALPHQECLAHRFQAEPSPAHHNLRDDYFGNRATFFTIEGAHRELRVETESDVLLRPLSPPAPESTPPWEAVRDAALEGLTPEAQAAREFCFASPLIPARAAYAEYAAPSFAAERPLLAAVLDLTARLHSDFRFDPKATSVATPLDQFFAQRRGVCQDFAHLQIACLRALGLPARYVSGYLETLPPAGKPKLTGADASPAWVQVWGEHALWVDVDPTNNLLPAERHITLAWGRDFADVSPMRGVVRGGGRHELKVAVDVLPISAAAT